jgi:cardiolipin-specific phospholipase
MVFFLFWTKSAIAQQISTRKEALSAAEARLVSLSHRFGSGSGSEGYSDFEVNVYDTKIPRSCVPLASHKTDLAFPEDNTDDAYTIHSIHITSNKSMNNSAEARNISKSDTPLILLHGYMNGGSYFYRNWGGLCRYFSNIHALDWLGWGLSSRPSWKLPPPRLQAVQKSTGNSNDDHDTTGAAEAENVFVESLEAWRKANRIDKMILAGHSMGGYVSVAYTERYPERVERLILLSPVGVNEETETMHQQRLARRQTLPLHWRLLWRFMEFAFQRMTVGDFLRHCLTQKQSRAFAHRYVTGRLPAIQNPLEQEALSDYLYHSCMLPGSAEYAIHNFLKPSILAHRPLIHRIPHLQVPNIGFIYGKHDWMDIEGGFQAQRLCSNNKASQVQVLQVPNAGHLLMLDNPEAFNEAFAIAAGKKMETETMTKLVVHPASSQATTNAAKLEAKIAVERAANVLSKKAD